MEHCSSHCGQSTDIAREPNYPFTHVLFINRRIQHIDIMMSMIQQLVTTVKVCHDYQEAST